MLRPEGEQNEKIAGAGRARYWSSDAEMERLEGFYYCGMCGFIGNRGLEEEGRGLRV